MSATRPRYVPHSTGSGKWDDTDQNAIVAHVLAGETVSGYLAYPYSFLIKITGGKYLAINSTGTLTYGGPDVGETGTGAGGVDGDDASAVIQACIDALTSGGKIYFAAGVYECTTPLTFANGIHFEGEFQGSWEVFTEGVVLKYTAGAVDAFIDAKDCRNISFTRLKLYNTGSAAIGLWVGGTANNASKTKMMVMSEVTIDGFASGIVGYDADHWGPDDSVFYQVVVGNCSTVAVDNLSSMCRFYGGTFHTSAIGVRMGRQQAVATPLAADAGMQFYGTVWSGCAIPLEIVGKQSMNMLSLFSCWIEDVDTMILRVTNSDSGITLGHILFDSCVMTTNSETYFDLKDRNLWLEVNGGVLYASNGNGAAIITDGTSSTVQHVRLSGGAGVGLGATSEPMVTFTDTNDGLHGFEYHVVPLAEYGIAGYTPAVPVSTTWSFNVACDHAAPLPLYTIVKATSIYRWNPNSASGEIRMYFSGAFGTSAPGASGVREDEVDCSAYVRKTVGGFGDLGVQSRDDNSTAITLYYAWLVLEW